MPIDSPKRRAKLSSSSSSGWFLSSPVPLSRLVILFYGFALNHLVKMVASGAGVDHCYSDIGCFPLSAEFYHPQHRPFNVRPWHRDLIKSQFELFNRQHPEGYMLLPWNRLNLLGSAFNPKLETKIIIPGWLDNINRALWVRKLKDSLLWLWAPVNVIVVRWRNFTPYTIATANTRVVGAELANLLKFIETELNYDRAYYHVIGHSLGAHIAGYCGDRIHGLGRITALDPARPFFQGMPKSVRLDRADAKFVDAIHSDFTPENAIFLLMSYGMTTPVGHLDFYPNGPPLFQPGCLRDTLVSVQTGIARGLEHNSLSIAFLESVRYLTACDHQRSHEWFIESITNRECAFVGVRCNEFEGMINGRCTCDDSPSACAIMGIHADQMYLNDVHEELWPVRAGSIDYKHNHFAPGPSKSVTQQQQQQQQQQLVGFETTNAHSSTMGGHFAHEPHHFLVPPPAGWSQLAPQAALPEFEGTVSDPSLALTYQLLQAQASSQATKDEIYARLKHQASRLQQLQEPSILNEHHHQATPDTFRYQDEAPPPVDAEHLDVQASEQVFEQHLGALDDLAFVQYLKVSLLSSQLDSGKSGGNLEVNKQEVESTTATAGSAPQRRRDGGANLEANRLGGRTSELNLEQHSSLDQMARRDGSQTSASSRRSSSPDFGHPNQFGGHPFLLSNLNRDIESWYEDNSKWFLKTNNRPSYCAHQYQLLIFLGPLKTASGRDSLRANLLVSIIGSRGQLLNQRFVPRGSTLSSFTMQPFFILLEGSYSLGQITSVAVAWEARNDPDPVQATIKFQSNLLEQVGSQVPAYQAKNSPWLSETGDHDKSEAFRFPHGPSLAAVGGFTGAGKSGQAAPSAGLLRSNIAGHYGNLYQRFETQRVPSLKTLGRRSDAEHQFKSSECRPMSSSRGQKLCGKVKARQATKTATTTTTTTTRAIERQPRSFERRLGADRLAGLDDPSQDVDLDYQAEAHEVREVDLAAQASASRSAPARADDSLDQLAADDSNLAPQMVISQLLLAQQANMLAAAGQQPSDSLDAAASMGSMFVPLVDLPHPATRARPGYLPVQQDDEFQLHQADGGLTMDLHNFEVHHQGQGENSIVINQVIVSPLQAYYGHHGRTAKTFCPPRSKRKLRQDKTVRLAPALMGTCR